MSKVAIPPSLNRGVFGWDAVKLSDAYTANELAAAIVHMCADPANVNQAHAEGTSIHLYTKATEKRTSALAMAIFYIKQEQKRGESA